MLGAGHAGELRRESSAAASKLISIGATAAAAKTAAGCGACGGDDITGDQRGSCDVSSGGCGGGSCGGPSASALIGFARHAADAAASPLAEQGFRGCCGEELNMDSSRPFSSCSTSCACCEEGSSAVPCNCAQIRAAERPPPGRAPGPRRSFEAPSCSITSQRNMQSLQSLASGVAVLSCLNFLDSYMPCYNLYIAPCNAAAGAEVGSLFLQGNMQGVDCSFCCWNRGHNQSEQHNVGQDGQWGQPDVQQPRRTERQLDGLQQHGQRGDYPPREVSNGISGKLAAQQGTPRCGAASPIAAAAAAAAAGSDQQGGIPRGTYPRQGPPCFGAAATAVASVCCCEPQHGSAAAAVAANKATAGVG